MFPVKTSKVCLGARDSHNMKEDPQQSRTDVSIFNNNKKIKCKVRFVNIRCELLFTVHTFQRLQSQ